MKPANTPIPADAKVQLVPDISRAELEQVMAWVKARATAEKLPFCWKKSYGRGVGTIPGRLADCDDGYSNHGATCFRNAHTILAPSQLATCPSGMLDAPTN